MEEAFEKLKKDGGNNVDNLVQWMKKSKVIDDSQEAETSTKKLFDDAQDKTNIGLDKFKQVVGKVAGDMKKSPEEISKMLAGGLAQLQGAATAAANAIKGVLK